MTPRSPENMRRSWTAATAIDCRFTGPSRCIVLTAPINTWLIFTAFKPHASWPRPLATVYGRVEAFRIVNGYGLFRVMTKDRGEIVIEGSADGIEWLPYEFKWKPGDVKRAPGWCAPHQPRLDWQMWFAALGAPQQNPWFGGLVVRLLQGYGREPVTCAQSVPRSAAMLHSGGFLSLPFYYCG